MLNMRSTRNRLDNHIYIYDLIRIVASFLVIINHSSGKVYFKFNPDSVEWYIAALLFIICKTAVPLFFMITGSLLLQKNAQSYKKMIKYILRIVIVLFAWTYIYSCYYNNGLLSIAETKTMIINAITNRPVITPLWYLYALIGLYLMAPFISRMTISFNNRDYLIFLSLWCFFNGLIPEINILLSNLFKTRLKLVGFFQYPLFMGWAGFFVLGYYISNRDKLTGLPVEKCTDAASRKILISVAVAILSLAVGVLSVVVTKKAGMIDNAGFLIIIILSALIYAAFIQHEDSYKRFIAKKKTLACIIRSISEATFGIYLSHRLIMDILLKKLSFSPQLNMLMESVLGVLLFDVVLFCICFGFIWLIKRIPIIRKIV